MLGSAAALFLMPALYLLFARESAAKTAAGEAFRAVSENNS